MKKLIIKRMIIGFVVGAIVGNAVAMISSLFFDEFAIITGTLKNSVGLVGGIILQSLLSGLIGMAGIGGMSLYDIEKWSLLSATVSHFICIMSSFTIAYFTLGWGNRNWVIYVIMFLSEALIFLLIWIIMYNQWKKKIEELNDDLIKYKEEKLNEEKD
ncbi:MAG: DUF3021 domain-containing protein [Acholeplasmatales bacterium]|nr:DUF3021 domain-containing protein [Acholeplasmatales bacterium]